MVGGAARTRRQLGDQDFDLALGPVLGTLQNRRAVLLVEMRRQPLDRAQVQATIRQHLQEHRMPPRRARHRDAQVGLRLREVEDLGAVHEEGGSRLACPEPTRIHLGEVGDEVGLDAS